MKLYKVLVEHYSQKDSHESIECFMVRESPEEVLDFIMEKKFWTKKELEEDQKFYKYKGTWNGWVNEFIEDEGQEIVSTETKYQRLLRLKGEINDELVLDGLSDLYYGATLYGWEEIKEVSADEIKILKECKILYEGEE